MNDATQTIMMLTVLAGVTLVLVLGFIIVRNIIEQRQAALARRLSGRQSSAETLLLDQVQQQNQPQGMAERLDMGFNRMIERTGLQLSPEQALALICLAGVGAAVALYLWRGDILLVAVGAVIGIAIPLVAFLFLQARWRRQLQQQLPDAFFLLARSLRAGLSLEQAIHLAGTEGVRPLATELKRCSDQIGLGLSIPAALQLTARRIGLLDFNVFVSIVTLHRSIGGNLTLLLDRLASSTRDRNQYAGYFRSATALGRATALFIGLSVPVILLGYLLFDPEYVMRFFQSGTGLAMLGIAFGLEIIGAIWIWSLLRVDY